MSGCNFNDELNKFMDTLKPLHLSPNDEKALREKVRYNTLAQNLMKSLQQVPRLVWQMRAAPATIGEECPTVLPEFAPVLLFARVLDLSGMANFNDCERPLFDLDYLNQNLPVNFLANLERKPLVKVLDLYRGYLKEALGEDSTNFKLIMRLADFGKDIRSDRWIFWIALDTLSRLSGFDNGLFAITTSRRA